MALECNNISFSFFDKETKKMKHILENTSFKLEDKGQIKLVYGHIGVGKSTLIYILAGLLENFDGEVVWDDFRFTKLNHKIDTLRSKYMSINFSNFFYIKDMSVEENIIFPAVFARRKQTLIDQRLEKIYDSFHHINLSPTETFSLKDYKHKKIGTLSNGQREIVMLARMLISDSKYLLADEMLRSFNTDVKKQMLKIVFEEFNLGVDNSMLLITHDDNMIEYMKHYSKGKVNIQAYDFKNKTLIERDI
ncbi:MAG: ATP-binding cassette domain-containing protein [Campylobacterota bacterium]|nr:ATP-binding cassette domain-containing protein [Campylobacterota bacterium]